LHVRSRRNMPLSMKLHELTPEALGMQAPEPPAPDIKVPRIDPHNPTREQALAALRSAYKQMVRGKVLNMKALANTALAPAILYLEGVRD
jgi:hypothetical protein